MKITAVIVGVNEWETYTRPAIESIHANDPDIDIIVIDNGSDPKYPILDDLVIRYKETVSYPEALNVGMKIESDWYILLNNDILFHKPIYKKLMRLDPCKLYGFYQWDDVRIFPTPFLSSWCLFVSRELHQEIGGFDEALKPMYFEDADFSLRAIQAGYPLELLDRDEWGIQHLESRLHERKKYKHKHSEAWRANRLYVMEKHGL